MQALHARRPTFPGSIASGCVTLRCTNGGHDAPPLTPLRATRQTPAQQRRAHRPRLDGRGGRLRAWTDSGRTHHDGRHQLHSSDYFRAASHVRDPDDDSADDDPAGADHHPARAERTAKPTPPPERVYAVLLRPGDSGPKVRDLQARLRQIGWYHADVTDYYGSRTTEAIRGFQQKRGFPVTGVTDERTYNRLLAMTRPPTRDELNNVKPAPSRSSWDVDKRCLTGRVICISKSTRSLTWVIDGTAQYSMDVRFGNEAQPTREGTFFIYKKQVDVISNIYFTPMPYSMFFSGGQAIHYSSDFARLGYNGSSHGCVNVRDWDGIVRLYNAAPVGTKVVIHW